MRRAAEAVVLFAALALGAGCGGGAGAADGAKQVIAPPPPPIDPSVPAGWVAVDEPAFFARVPLGFERTDTATSHTRSARKDGVSYVVSWSTLADANADPDAVFFSASEAFFKGCRGARLRSVRADTLEHKTVTVDGTCSPNRPSMGQIHLRGRELVQLYIIVETGSGGSDTDELRAFFQAFRVKSK